MKKTIIAATAAAALFGAFVCLPHVRGQNGTTANATSKTNRKTSSGPVSGSSGALKIAFLDMGMISRDYRKMADKRRDADAVAEAGNAKIRQIDGEMQALAKPVQEGKIDKECDEYVARTRQLYQLDNSRKACKAQAERDMTLQSVKAAASVYEDVQAALKLFCEQNGYTLVLQIDRGAAKTQDYRMFQKAIGEKVFYYRAQEDITVAVLSYLNQQYDAEHPETESDDNADPAASAEPPIRSIPASPNRKPKTR